MLRDLFMGKTRFADFLDSPEGIASSILTNRLKSLEAGGLVVRKSYQDRPVRYEYHLSSAGWDSLPILQSLATWASRHISPVWKPPERFFSLTPENWEKRARVVDA